MKILTVLAAAAAITIAAPLAQAAYYPNGWSQLEALGTTAHPFRTVPPAYRAPHTRVDYGLTYTRPGTATGGPSGGFPDQP